MVELEREIADLHRKEAALVFTSGHVSNQTGIATIAKLIPDCLILSDALNHNSMIEGVRQSGCEKRIWRHNDVKHLEQLLRQAGAERPKLIVFETLYSMDGDIAPVHRICDLAGPLWSQWQAGHIEHSFYPRSPFLMSLAFPARSLEVTDCRGGGRTNRWRERGRENETRCIRRHGVDHYAFCANVAADAAERLRQRALEHVYSIHGAIAFRNAPAPRAPYMPTACTSSA